MGVQQRAQRVRLVVGRYEGEALVAATGATGLAAGEPTKGVQLLDSAAGAQAATYPA